MSGWYISNASMKPAVGGVSLGTSVPRNLHSKELEVSCCVLFEENI
ncbi:hypothetical protein HanPI659440_Chr05g0205301 [Helianthus annuus]|nr:hypothetical protein HanPI659440_Chr05g0205301 [Helianthus annuus]